MGGAITGVAPLYAASVVAGALVEVLAVMGPSGAVSKELALLQEKTAQATREEEKDRVRPAAGIQDIRELREFITGLTRVLKTAEEVEAIRSANLERAVRDAASGLAEAERLIDAARQRVTDVGKILAEAEGGGVGGSTPGGWSGR